MLKNLETLRKEAEEKGLEVAEGATKAEIQALLDEVEKSEKPADETTQADLENKEIEENGHTGDGEGDVNGEAAPEGTGEAPAVDGDKSATEKAAEDIETPSLPETEVTPTAAPVAPKKSETPAAVAQSDISAAQAIGEAIAKGLADSKEEKKMVVSVDESVQPRFSLVRDQSTGEVLTRENETGVLSQLQLKSLEEKQNDLQNRDVEEV